MSQAGQAQNFVGASGFSFPHWKGQFYPKTQHPLLGLPYYAAHLGTVELNNTFYHLPSRD